MSNLIFISSAFFYITAWSSRKTKFSVANIHEGFGNTGTHLLHRRKKQHRPFPGINSAKRASLPFNTKHISGYIKWGLASAVRAHIQPHGPPLKRINPQCVCVCARLVLSLSPVWNSAILFSHVTQLYEWNQSEQWPEQVPSVLQHQLSLICTSVCSVRNARWRKRRELAVYLLALQSYLLISSLSLWYLFFYFPLLVF
jgi:hypothetical protein